MQQVTLKVSLLVTLLTHAIYPPTPVAQSETQFYEKVQADSLAQIKQAEGEGAEAGRSSYVNMLYMLLKLRQACNHPWLVKGASACKGLPAAGVEVWKRGCEESVRAKGVHWGYEVTSSGRRCGWGWTLDL